MSGLVVRRGSRVRQTRLRQTIHETDFWNTLASEPSLHADAAAPPLKEEEEEEEEEEEKERYTRYDEGLGSPNDIYRLVQELRWCLSEFGASTSSAEDEERRDRDVEGWACLIYESMSAPSRTFHDVGHGFDIAKGGDAVQVYAGLFHDVVYYSIDGGLSAAQARVLDGVIDESDDDGTVRLDDDICERDARVAMVVALFGFEPGQVLNPYSGLNEFLSAVVAVRCLQDTVGDALLLQVAACIELTIPFRARDANGRCPCERLHDRLRAVSADVGSGLGEREIVRAVQRAIELANRDVGNFAETDPAQFLSNTWSLLPESNIELRSDRTGHLSSFLMALKKMHGFLSNLDAGVIYGSFRGVPSLDEERAITEMATKNLRTATKYLQVKILALCLITALAELTGGDAALIMFVKGMSVDVSDEQGKKNAPKTYRERRALAAADMKGGSFSIENLTIQEEEEEEESVEDEHTEGRISFIENFGAVRRTISRVVQCDKVVYNLLKHGRKDETSFDLNNSPVGAYLYGMLGDEGLKEPFRYCACPMDAGNATRLLDALPPKAVEFIATCMTRIVLTRSQKLADIACVYSKRCDSDR